MKIEHDALQHEQSTATERFPRKSQNSNSLRRRLFKRVFSCVYRHIIWPPFQLFTYFFLLVPNSLDLKQTLLYMATIITTVTHSSSLTTLNLVRWWILWNSHHFTQDKQGNQKFFKSTRNFIAKAKLSNEVGRSWERTLKNDYNWTISYKLKRQEESHTDMRCKTLQKKYKINKCSVLKNKRLHEQKSWAGH